MVKKVKVKGDKKRKEAMKAYFIIVNLVIASFAFAYLVGAEVLTDEDDTDFRNNLHSNAPSTTPLGSQAGVSAGAASTLGSSAKTWAYAHTEGTTKHVLEISSESGKLVNKLDGKIISNDALKQAAGTAKIDISGAINSAAKETLTGLNTNLGELTAGQSLNDGVLEVTRISPVGENQVEVVLKDMSGKEIVMKGDPTKPTSGFAKDYYAKSTAEAAPGQTTLSNLFGVTQGGFMDAALSGVQYAAIWYGVGYMAGSLFGMEKKQTSALSTALASGAFTYEILSRWTDKIDMAKGLWAKPGEKGLLDMIGLKGGPGALGTGIIVAAVLFLFLYEKESTEIVTFTCEPWQAPVGRIAGNDCEKCNLEEGCSEYRCKSLGQACQLLNAGTTDEKCAWVNPKDTTSPQIGMWEDVLTKGYKYEPDTAIRPPARGVKILKATGDKCVKAFTPLEFGIITDDEPAQCKIDYNHTLKFDDMGFWFGESNLFSYNHSQKMSLPSPSSIQAAAPELQHNGTYTLYVRCQDANGNANVDEFAVRFCVEAGPDTTPPEIVGTSIANNMPVKYNQSNVELEVYVNEPSECKWGREDRGYDELENSMACSTNVWEMNNNNVYTCKTTLTGVKDRQENVFWFRCKDQPWANESERNENQQGYKFTLAGTEPLNIIDINPNGTLYGSTDVVSVWLEVETANGYRNGDAVCYFSDTKSEADYIEFAETGSSIHKQRLDLIEGGYKYYVKCLDLGGNRDDNETEFRVEVDREAPVIARVYREDELLKIITIEDSECRYSIQSCNFKFEDGIDMPYANQTTHAAEWKTENTYYIRCSDKYGNQPLPNSCSMVVRPYDVTQQIVEE